MVKMCQRNGKRVLLFQFLKKEVMDCGAYRKVKLLEHATVERELENRI